MTSSATFKNRSRQREPGGPSRGPATRTSQMAERPLVLAIGLGLLWGGSCQFHLQGCVHSSVTSHVACRLVRNSLCCSRC